jgi:rhamnose transport system substrate-binding protein
MKRMRHTYEFIVEAIAKNRSYLSGLRSLSIIMTFLMVLTSCNSPQTSNSESAQENKPIKMAMIPKVIGSAYFDKCAEGAQLIADELGIELIYKGPTTADAAAQVNIIQNMIFNEVDIIAISPIDPAAVQPILRQAKEEGIIVITFDADVDGDYREVFVSQVSEEKLGRHLMDNVAQGIGGKGRFAILTASMTAPNQNTWIEWMKKHMNENYPDMELVSIIPTDEDQQKAYNQTQNLIQAYTDLQSIVALSTVAEPGAARAIEDLGKIGQVKLYGLALPNDMRKFLKSGAAQSATLWDPYDLGELTVHIGYKVYMGEEIIGNTMIGNIGPIQYLSSERVVIMGNPLDFTKENVDEYDF